MWVRGITSTSVNSRHSIALNTSSSSLTICVVTFTFDDGLSCVVVVLTELGACGVTPLVVELIEAGMGFGTLFEDLGTGALNALVEVGIVVGSDDCCLFLAKEA